MTTIIIELFKIFYNLLEEPVYLNFDDCTTIRKTNHKNEYDENQYQKYDAINNYIAEETQIYDKRKVQNDINNMLLKKQKISKKPKFIWQYKLYDNIICEICNSECHETWMMFDKVFCGSKCREEYFINNKLKI